MENIEEEIKKYKFGIRALNIFIICIIIFLGIALIRADEITKCFIAVFGIICIKLLWNKLDDTIEYYNYLIDKNNKFNVYNKTVNTTFNKNNEKNSDRELCKECFKEISFEQYVNYDRLCKKCYKAKKEEQRNEEEQHYCDICQELLTQEEYEDYICYCEDCYIDMNVQYKYYGLHDYIGPFIEGTDLPDVWYDYYNKY